MNGMLTTEQIDVAILTLMHRWEGKPLTDSERAEWRKVLSKLVHGEFTPTLDAWHETPKGHLRPAPGEFLALAYERRPAPKPRYWQPDPDAPPTDWPLGQRELQRIRDACHRRHQDHVVANGEAVHHG